MEIETLLAQAESKTLEFKRDLSSLEPILKTIIAFANTAGGTLLIGRSEQGALFGIQDVFRAEEALVNSISDNIRPPILPEIEIATVSGKDFLVVKVSHWKGPFYLKKEGIPKGVYIRLGSTSRPAGPEILAELQRSILTISFDQQALPDLVSQDLDLDQARRVFQSIGKEINEEKLRSLGVFVSSARRWVPSIGGFILFGAKEKRRQFIPDARVSCARFHGPDKTHILDRTEIEGTILDAVNEVPVFIRRNTRLAAEIKEIQRRDIPEYPPLAVREALINALAHADYSLVGSHIQIAIYSNRLEIQNPGMFPFGFTIEDLKAGVSRVRNRVITRVFHELQWMEEWGSGYKRILEICRREGYPVPRWEELGTSIRVTFYPHPQTVLKEREFILREEIEDRQPVAEFSDREEAILRLFQQDESLPFRALFKKLSPSMSERTLRYDLAQLKKKGLLRSKGMGRALVWRKINST